MKIIHCIEDCISNEVYKLCGDEEIKSRKQQLKYAYFLRKVKNFYTFRRE